MRRISCGLLFFFCLLFPSLVALQAQDRYLPISEKELQRSEEISGLLARILTARQEQDSRLKELLDKQAKQIENSKSLSDKQDRQIAKLSGYLETALSELKRAGSSFESSKKSFDGYVGVVSSTTAAQEKLLAEAQTQVRLWRTIAIVAGLLFVATVLVVIALKRLMVW